MPTNQDAYLTCRCHLLTGTEAQR